MARPAKVLVDKTLAEVRDPQGMATTRAQALSLVSSCQQQVNASLDDVIISTPFNLPPYTQIYPITFDFPDAVRILTVRDDSGRDIDKLGERADIASGWLNSSWFTEVGTQLRSWGLIGRDLLVLRPGLRMQTTITVRYTRVTPTLAIEADPTVVPDEDDPAITDLAALLIRMKSRDFNALDRDFTRFQETIKHLRETKR
jgi:hypothetical protein